MDQPDIVVELGLPEALRPQAVEIFEEAFGSKMRTAIGDQRERMAFMRRAYQADNVIIARDDGRLLGLAGLSSRGAPYDGGLLGSSWDPRPYRDLLGWVGATWAVWGLRMSERRPKDDELYLDGIAVAPEARGLGVGTRLLDETTRLARAHGKRFVRLDVIDTHPRALAHYERVG